MKKSILLFLMVVLVTIPSAQAGDDTVLAKVGGITITMSDFNRMISYYDYEKNKALEANPMYKAIILQRIVQGIILSKIAYEKGFDQKPDIKEQIGLLTRDFLLFPFYVFFNSFGI